MDWNLLKLLKFKRNRSIESPVIGASPIESTVSMFNGVRYATDTVSVDTKWGSFNLIVRPSTIDKLMIDVVIHGNEYQLPDRLSGLVLDVGAHIGCFSIAAALRGADVVVACEAHFDNYLILCANATAITATLGCRIIPLYIGVVGSDYVGATVRIPITFPAHNGFDNTAGNGIQPDIDRTVDNLTEQVATHYRTPAFSFDFLNSAIRTAFPSLPRTLLKIDAEGSEYSICSHSKTIADWQYIVGEYHLGLHHPPLDSLVKALQHAGFIVDTIQKYELLGHFKAYKT